MINLTTRDYPRATIIRVEGRVDASTYQQLESKINEYIGAERIHIVLEMDATEYLSSAGARVLIAAQKTLKPKGGRLALSQPSQRVKEVLELAGLESLFPIYADTIAAVGSE
jgi:anti-anti-sigma factor